MTTINQETPAMSTDDPGAPTPYAKHPIGTLFASVRDEIDDDHRGLVRTTPAGSIWEVVSIDRYSYPASKNAPAGSVCAYTLACPATGAAITPYTSIEGEPFGHPRDEMADFILLDLPGQTWPTLRQQLKALCEIKDAVVDAADQEEADPLDEDADIAAELTDTVTNELRKAGLMPAPQP